MKVHPLYFALPVTVACSFSFMLPGATPSNAIIFGFAKLRVYEMVSPMLQSTLGAPFSGKSKSYRNERRSEQAAPFRGRQPHY